MRNRDARLARGNQTGRIAAISMSLRVVLDTVLTRFHRVPTDALEPAAERELAGAQEPVVTTADSAATA